LTASDLDGARIADEVERLGGTFGRAATVLVETGSTNDDAKAAANEGAAHGSVFVAESQTRGRGRVRRVWHSPVGENVYASIVLRPEGVHARSSSVALVVGLAVARTVDEALRRTGLDARVKWPNDVHVRGRKIAGILAEAQFRGEKLSSLVVGVGLNVRTLDFGTDLEATATSLALEGARELDRSTIAARLFVAVERVFDAFLRDGLAPFMGELARRDVLRGRAVQVGDVRGVAEGIDSEGRLLVRDADGRLLPLASGEATTRAT